MVIYNKECQKVSHVSTELNTTTFVENKNDKATGNMNENTVVDTDKSDPEVSLAYKNLSDSNNARNKVQTTRHLSLEKKSSRKKILLSNGKQDCIKRKDIKFKSPNVTKLRPKISPKLKKLIKSCQKDKIKDKNEVISIKTETKKCTNSPSILKKSRLVKNLISYF